MLGATAARTKYKSATTTQNIETSRTGSGAHDELGSAEPGDLDQYPVAGDRVLNRDHAAGHYDHSVPQWHPRCSERLREPGQRVQRFPNHTPASPAADFLP